MRKIFGLVLGGALMMAAGAAHAQSLVYTNGAALPNTTFGTTQMYSPYGPMADVGANFNPGGDYGLRSTEAGASGAVYAGTSIPASVDQVRTGRAAVVGAPAE